MAAVDISHVSDLSIKHWLKVQKLPHSANTNEQLNSLLYKLTKEGQLTQASLAEGILEIEETGSKNIFLRLMIDKSAVKSEAVFKSHLKSIGLKNYRTQRHTVKQPKRPSLNYVEWVEHSDPQIRIKFSETHVEPKVDFERRQFEDEEVTKFIVIIAEPASGFVQIRMDKPLKVHSHKDEHGISRPYLYEQYYFDKASSILGSELQQYDIRGVARQLANTTPRLIYLPWESVRTGANSRLTTSSSGEVDVRDDPAHEAAHNVDGTNWRYEDLAFYWLGQPSGGQLERNLFMKVKSQNGMITFLADCLENEVEYAISRIKEARSRIPTA